MRRVISTVHLFEQHVFWNNTKRLSEVAITTLGDGSGKPSIAGMTPDQGEDLLLASCLALRQMNNLGGEKGDRLADLLEELPDKLVRLSGSSSIGPLMYRNADPVGSVLGRTGPELVAFSGSAAPKHFINTLTFEESGQINYSLKLKGVGFFPGPLDEITICSVMAFVLNVVNRHGVVMINPLSIALGRCASAHLDRRVGITNQREIAVAAAKAAASN